MHFSLLKLEDAVPLRWPVVMTVPMNFSLPNLIVGADVREFLGLGVRHGYFELEQLAYHRDDTGAWLDHSPLRSDYPAIKVSALKAIERTFDINPWENSRQKIAELQASFRLD